jgi:hypothetical protein
MKKIIGLLLLLLGASVYAQDKVLITPGSGVGELKIGMKMKAVKKLLGREEHSVNEKEERKAFVNAGYAPSDFLVFKLGFDKCLTYANNKADYPVFKVYFKKKKVCYIVISGADFGSVRASRFTTGANVGFNSKKEDLLRGYGQPQRVNAMAGYDGEYVYEKLGFSAVVEKDGSIISMDIFPPQ